MPGKGKKVFARPVTDFMVAEDEPVDHTVTFDSGQGSTVQAIRQIISMEIAKVTRKVGKIDSEFKIFRQKISPSLTNFEEKFDLKLATISQKLDRLESAQQDSARKGEAVTAKDAAVDTHFD